MFVIILLITHFCPYLFTQPIAFTQINSLRSWWPQANIARSIGIPTYSNTTYNYFSFQLWTCASGLSAIPQIYAKPLSVFGPNFLGITNLQIRTQLKRLYQSAGTKVILGVFGDLELPVQFGRNSSICAQKLAQDVRLNDFDGVQINYKDYFTFEQGTAEPWLIQFTKTLRDLLPSHKIIHTVDSMLLRPFIYPNEGYMKINREVGQMIDFYNIKYFGNANNPYMTYDDLFINANESYANTSVRQIAQQGFDLNKIVVGKSTVTGISGAVTAVVLRDWANRARQQLGWNTGFWLGDFANDSNGSSIITVLSLLRNQTLESNNMTTSMTNTTINNQTNSSSNSPDTNTTSNPATNMSITNSTLPYPVYFVYVNSVSAWWGQEFLENLGVPGYGQNLPYNYIALAFWLSYGPADVALAWANAGTYFSWISNDTQIVQKTLKKAYNDAGKKIMVSTFGSTEFPTTSGADPIITSNKLADFILANNLDGVDVNWQDNFAMEAGTGQEWIIKFHIQLRSRLPSHIITHSPQAPYFKRQAYRNGAYMTIHNRIGSTIDFYNVQFYNQGDTRYESYEELFLRASGFFSGTSVHELIDRGIPARQIIVGKPAAVADVMNTGYVTPQDFGDYWRQFRAEKGIQPQIMYWQLRSDRQGNVIRTVLSRALAGINGNSTAQNTTSNTKSNITSNTTNSTTNYTKSNATSSSEPYILSMFYCGFGNDFCGQSTFDDVNPKTSFVALAFANTLLNGGIEVDRSNYPFTVVNTWKASGKKVFLSVGGQNGRWDVVFVSPSNINNFINAVHSTLIQFNLDGIDLDIQSYMTSPRAVANMIIALKTKIRPKLLVVSPECVTVYGGVPVPSADIGGQAWNYFVPIIRAADSSIDFYQVQAYNNWYGGLAGGSFAYIKQVYLHWRNLPGTIPWSSVIGEFSGVDGNKLLMGVLASTSAGVASYYAPANVIGQFKSWLRTNNYPLKGFMMWNSNWDRLNNYQISNATTNPL